MRKIPGCFLCVFSLSLTSLEKNKKSPNPELLPPAPPFKEACSKNTDRCVVMSQRAGVTLPGWQPNGQNRRDGAAKPQSINKKHSHFVGGCKQRAKCRGFCWVMNQETGSSLSPALSSVLSSLSFSFIILTALCS